MDRQTARTWDGVVGFILCFFSLGGFCIGLLGMGLGALVGVASVAEGLRTGPGAAIVGGLLGGAAIFFSLLAMLQFVGGIGLIKGRRWGHMLTAMVAGSQLLFGLMAGEPFSITGGLLAGIYCLLRLTGKLGSKPA